MSSAGLSPSTPPDHTSEQPQPSAESERGPSTRSCQSPRRGPAPPPIKVPKLRAALVAVTAHGDTSPNPSATTSVLSRHRATGSESNVIRDRRCGGLGWPTLTRSESFNNLAPRLGSHAIAANRESNSPGSDALENLAGSPPSTKVQISISGPLKQPQPVPAYHSSSNGAPAEVMPSTLPISRHSRSINSLSGRQTRHSPSPSPSPRSVSPIPTPTSADNARIVSVSHRLTKADNLATPPQRVSLVNPSSHTNSEPRRAMPFPISKTMSSSADDDAKANEASFPPHHSGLLPETPRVRRLPSTDCLSQRNHRLDSTASFDVRNLPFTFDGCLQTPTSQTSDNTLQRLSIPQSPFIPQLIAIPQLPRIPSITGPMLDSGSNFPSVRSNGSNSSTFTPRRYHSRVFTPSTSTESTYSPHTNGRDPERHPRSRSADDLSVATNDPTPKFASRPRSMSDRGPDRPILLSNCFNGLKKSSPDPDQHLPERPFSIVSSFAHPGTTRSFPWATRSIDAHLRDLDLIAQNQLVDHALKLYPMNAHRFVVGDTTKLLAEGRECEERAQELHVRYLSDMAKRETLLKRHVVTLRAFNGEEGARFGDSLIKAINQSDAGVSELLSLVDHTSRVERMCDSHWRAAAAVELRTLQNTREKLSAAEAKIQLLEADRARDQRRIEELEARLRSSPQQSEVEPQRRKGTLPNGVNPGLPFPATSNGQGSFSPPVPGQTAPLNIRNPSNAATRPPMRRLNFVNTGPRVMSVFEVSSHRSSSAASPIIQPARLRLFDKRFGSSSTDQNHDSLGPNAGLQHFESPREAPAAPIVTPEYEPTAFLTRALHQANPVITQEASKPVKRPGLQFGQAARNLFTSNLRRKACELVGPSNPASMLSPRERPQPNQFATWSPESAARRHEPLSNLFMPPTIEEQTGVHETVLVPQQHRGQIAPQVPPTQLQLAPPPPPPGPSKLAPFRATEGSGSRGRPKWAGCDGSTGNLTSITLSQLGSLDIAHLLTDLAPTPSPTLRIFNQAGGPQSFSPGSSLVAQS
ncbi:hypothetical protein CROQUDRAFT_131066 [Cronartium quercuum f. sp. fusiforme G11]|uniref:Uncharacterized protein n=1 Tax=Cronartium quercuum f. sp. fusiforme G11 TaxID=708437 RepID=A0A9P6NTA1_9BASI|nr:hypothetical protein CROQUDRAFT_131066 [Cronartium quercuum f. sp. fusiforme G11]